ncbi:MAG: VOC family protein [Steroidobacteraceae bacterium]
MIAHTTLPVSDYAKSKTFYTNVLATLGYKKIDLSWLLHHMLSGYGARGPGLGVLPAEWLNG